MTGDLQAFFAQALKFIGRGAGLERHPANDLDPTFCQCGSGLFHLLKAFYRARTGDDWETSISNDQAIRKFNHSALIGILAFNQHLLERGFFFHVQRHAEDLMENRLDGVVAEGTLVCHF